MFFLPDSLKNRRILVVENEYLIADEIESWLRAAGAEVLGPVPNVKQALNLIDRAAGTLDAATLDVNLSEGETAYPIAARLEEYGVPFLFATAIMKLADGSKYQDRLRLEKPISQRDLLWGLQRLLA